MSRLDDPRDLRAASWLRGIFIAVLIVFYGWFTGQPDSSFTGTVLVGALVQFAIIVIRKFLPPGQLERAQYIFEMIADGVTILMFAIGVFGRQLSLASSI